MRANRKETFGLLLLCLVIATSRVEAQDASFMGVAKGVSHRQTGPATVVLGSNPYEFNAFLNLTGPGRVLSASVTPAGRSAIPLVSSEEGWDLFSTFSSQAALDGAFPNGEFALKITGQSDGPRTVTLLLGGDAFPPVPTLNGFDDLQRLVPGNPLTLSWQPFTGGAATDFVQLTIRADHGMSEETVFRTGEPGQPGALNGTQTSVTVPAGTLTPGPSYSGELLFAKIVEFDLSYGGGVMAVAAYYRQLSFPLVVAGQTDTDPPQFWGARPGANDGPVPRNSGIAFEFSEPMQASQSVAWTGLDPAKFTYRWSTDGRVLFCLYAQQLPANATVSWRINRSAFRDVAGNVLPFDQEGTLTTAGADASGVPDIAIAGLWKSESYTQKPGGAPQIRAEQGFAAGAFADSTAFNTVIAGTLRLPNGMENPLEFDHGDSLSLEMEVNSKAELDANAPAGTYRLTLETVHQGTRIATLTTPGDAYPSVPEFQNLSAAQGFDPAQPLALAWKPMVGGTANDFIGLWIEPTNGGDSVFETPEFFSGQGLTGTATSLTIPAGTMRPGRTYDVELEFVHPTTRDTATLPGSTLVVAFTRITHVQITAAGMVTPPQVRLSPTPDNRWLLRVTGDPGVNYVLEATNQLGSGWNAMANFQIFGDAFEWTDGMPSGQRFYRVREGF